MVSCMMKPESNPEGFNRTISTIARLVYKNSPNACPFVVHPMHKSDHVDGRPPTIPEFKDDDEAFQLPYDKVITHMDATHHPSAWIMRDGRMVPFEFIRSDEARHHSQGRW